jgi:hypothetical protein
MSKPGVYSQKSSTDDHVTVIIQADGGVNVHMAELQLHQFPKKKRILIVLLRAECPLHPRVIEDFV